MKKNIIFDFGKVLVEFSPIKMTEKYVKNEQDVKMISDIVFARKYWDRLDDASITDGEIIEGFSAELPEHLVDLGITVYNNWVSSLTFIDGMPHLVEKLKENGKKLYLLSNISVGFVESYRDVPEINNLLSLFDGLVFSGPLGITKPNKEIFKHLLNTYHLDADDCIFIDDSKINIDGAKNAGIEGYLFDGDAKKLEKYLFQE